MVIGAKRVSYAMVFSPLDQAAENGPTPVKDKGKRIKDGSDVLLLSLSFIPSGFC
jgi:hypothetical protein